MLEILLTVLIAFLMALTFRIYRGLRKAEGKSSPSSPEIAEEVVPTLKVSPSQPESRLLAEMKTVEVSDVHKSFGGKEVVSGVSFEVKVGEIFGIVGPNGAGKTTTIRMLMDIIKPDAGKIDILGEAIGESIKDRIGYLPEERGLYRKITVAQSLDYLARLKGLTPQEAQSGADALLRRVGMFPHKDKKVEQLSRGMGQLIQFITTIVHDPDLVILDEPFSGLDPVNREMLKDMVRELRSSGKTVIMSTHQMNEVEELCDRILMIDKGRVVLYGELAEIRGRFRRNSIFLEYEGPIEGLTGIVGKKDHGHYTELFLDGKTSPQDVLSQLLTRGIRVDRFEVSTPSLNEIFVQVAKGER